MNDEKKFKKRNIIFDHIIKLYLKKYENKDNSEFALRNGVS